LLISFCNTCLLVIYEALKIEVFLSGMTHVDKVQGVLNENMLARKKKDEHVST
jgi:nitrate reductase NapAB chaperone NapD